MMDDQTFNSLPRSLRDHIDRAFVLAIQPNGPPPQKRRKITHDSEEPAGGFIVEDTNAGEGSAGGFVVDEPSGGFMSEGPTNDDPVESKTPANIPLSLIPTALQILDLPPDDEQVLSVFKNAASGWMNSRTETAELVSKKDWRAVCSVLLAQQAVDKDEESDGMEGSGEEYVASDEEDQDSDFGDPEDEEYAEDLPQKKSRRKSGGPPRVSSDDEIDVSNRPLTARQKETSREAFSLFFPNVDGVDLGSKRITASDLTRVSKDLKEQLTQDQITEMLAYISTSTEKSSVSLLDFEKMMVEARMV